MAVSSAKQQDHFVLVHGAGHGAWCWFKLKPLLEAAGHRVTAIDLSASGLNRKTILEIHTFHDYTVPLLEVMAAIPPNEKVILVGHSYGGLSLALAMDHYPQKISVAIFVAAGMPDTIHAPSYPLEQFLERNPLEKWLLDTDFITYGSPEDRRTSILCGPQYISSKMYHKCSTEDIELGKLLIRPSSSFIEDLSKAKKFSTQGFGSVQQAYIICNEDKAMPADFQLWLVENNGVTEVKEIKDVDHMPMLSVPQELFKCLIEIVNKCCT